MLMKSQTMFKGKIFQKKDAQGVPQPWYTSGTYTKNNGQPGQWARFAVAVWQKKDKQADKNIYEYFNCTVYDSQAENLPWFYEGGDFVLIVGEIGIDTYQDNNGQTKKSVKVTVSEMGKQPNPFAGDNKQPRGAQPQYQQPPAQYGGYQQQAPMQYPYQQQVNQAMGAVQAARQPQSMQQDGFDFNYDEIAAAASKVKETGMPTDIPF